MAKDYKERHQANPSPVNLANWEATTQYTSRYLGYHHETFELVHGQLQSGDHYISRAEHAPPKRVTTLALPSPTARYLVEYNSGVKTYITMPGIAKNRRESVGKVNKQGGRKPKTGGEIDYCGRGDDGSMFASLPHGAMSLKW